MNNLHILCFNTISAPSQQATYSQATYRWDMLLDSSAVSLVLDLVQNHPCCSRSTLRPCLTTSTMPTLPAKTTRCWSTRGTIQFHQLANCCHMKLSCVTSLFTSTKPPPLIRNIARTWWRVNGSGDLLSDKRHFHVEQDNQSQRPCWCHFWTAANTCLSFIFPKCISTSV